MLHSSSATERSAILAPLVKLLPGAAGLPVLLKRTDSGPDPVTVRIAGLDTNGERISEAVTLDAGREAATASSFLIADTAEASGGRITVARAYPLGASTPSGMVWEHDDLPAALAELHRESPTLGRLRNITSGAKSDLDAVPEGTATAWALSALPAILFPDSDPATGAEAVDAFVELASLARPHFEAPPLLPARIHLLFRGLPGLWACASIRSAH